MSIVSNLTQKFDDLQALAGERLNTCKTCPFFSPKNPNATFSYATCTSCGCVLEAKTLIPRATCPSHRWAR